VSPTDVQMVAAGIDITIIGSLLGHVSLDTTNHYARANIETKRRALEQVDRSTRPSGPPALEAKPELARLARLLVTLEIIRSMMGAAPGEKQNPGRVLRITESFP
jgi:hypothetical protein